MENVVKPLHNWTKISSPVSYKLFYLYGVIFLFKALCRSLSIIYLQTLYVRCTIKIKVPVMLWCTLHCCWSSFNWEDHLTNADVTRAFSQTKAGRTLSPSTRTHTDRREKKQNNRKCFAHSCSDYCMNRRQAHNHTQSVALEGFPPTHSETRVVSVRALELLKPSCVCIHTSV